MAAPRKLGSIEVELLVAGRASGRSLRQIARSLGVAHSTLSRRIAGDSVLRARICEVEKREARRARDRERKRRARAGRKAGLAQGGAESANVDAGQAAMAAVSAARRGVRTRPHGRRDELRLARRILLDRDAPVGARMLALEQLIELLDATRSNGQPAYSLRLAAVSAILKNPVLVDKVAAASGSSRRRRQRR